MHSFSDVRTGHAVFDEILPRIKEFLAQDTMDCVIDAVPIHGYRTPDARSIWIRDHADMMRGARYFDPEMKSTVEHFAHTQAQNGRVFDYFTVHPEKLPSERENWTKYVRVPVEADVEYRWVKGLYLAWQVTMDDEWALSLLPVAEKALRYAFTHPWRWDSEHQLVKRAYTIDTWDFDYTAGRHDWLNFQITPETFWGIMHGDSSGYYEATRLLARMYDRLGRPADRDRWDEFAAAYRQRANEVSWNGRFYRHFVPLVPVHIEGVDEAEQLSLSNPMDINRGLATHEMAVAILKEYQHRRRQSAAFAEWFSIDPPFPDGLFGDPKLVKGAYVNGGIMPLVGGELARAAFEHGFEDYGVDILLRYMKMVRETGATYLWYFPDGTPATVETSTSPEAQPTDGWGSSAMLYAFVEGLCGVVDEGCGFDRVRLAPRWQAAGQDEAAVRLHYPASGRSFGYEYRSQSDGVELQIDGKAEVTLHLLLPQGVQTTEVVAHGQTIPHENETIESSPYVNARLTVDGKAVVHVRWQQNSPPA